MSRLNLVKGLGPVLQIAEGWTVDLPAEVHETARRAHRPHLADPLVRAAPDRAAAPSRDVYSVMANWGANHGALSYGHIGADLIALASMLRIPVCMHNVPADSTLPPQRLERLRHRRPRRRRLPRLRRLRPALR